MFRSFEIVSHDSPSLPFASLLISKNHCSTSKGSISSANHVQRLRLVGNRDQLAGGSPERRPSVLTACVRILRLSQRFDTELIPRVAVARMSLMIGGGENGRPPASDHFPYDEVPAGNLRPDSCLDQSCAHPSRQARHPATSARILRVRRQRPRSRRPPSTLGVSPGAARTGMLTT